MAFELSTRAVDITPAPGTNPYLAGYGSQTTPRSVSTNKPRRPLKARCVVLWDDDRPIAVVSLDILGVPRSMNQRLRPRLRELATWTDADVMITGSHTHNGPVVIDYLHPFATYGLLDLGGIQTYSSWLEDAIVDLVRSALMADRTPVTLEYSVTTETFAYNRRGLPYVETAVPVMVARSAAGDPRAVLFGYAAHPTAGGMRTQFDPDYPGGACAAIEAAHPDCLALFLLGAAGDQGPLGITGSDSADARGAQLGATVLAAVARPGRPVDGPVRTQLTEFPLPLEISTDAKTLATFRSAFVERLKNQEGQPAYYQRHAEVMIARIDTGNVSTTVPFLARLWTFGEADPLRLLFTSGELVSGYAVYFRARYGGAARLWVGGYADELPCYIPSNQFFPPTMPNGSYEGGWATDFPAVGAGNMAAYGWAAHFRYGPGGVEQAVIAGITSLLA